MSEDEAEEKRLRAAALKNVEEILKARQRAERELVAANEALERKTQELQQQRQWYEVTLASIGDAVITTDVDGRVTFLNPVAEAMTGWTHGRSSGATAAERVSDRQRRHATSRRKPHREGACQRPRRRARESHRADRSRRHRALDRGQRRADPRRQTARSSAPSWSFMTSRAPAKRSARCEPAKSDCARCSPRPPSALASPISTAPFTRRIAVSARCWGTPSRS